MGKESRKWKTQELCLWVCSSYFTRRMGLCLVKSNELVVGVRGSTPFCQFRKPVQTCPKEHKESSLPFEEWHDTISFLAVTLELDKILSSEENLSTGGGICLHL